MLWKWERNVKRAKNKNKSKVTQNIGKNKEENKEEEREKFEYRPKMIKCEK